MFDPQQFALFFAAALLLAATPGPGIFYVAARTLSGGRGEGIASSFGNGLGGLFHVVAGAVGVSALVLASAELFTALKFIGAAYLVWLGFRTLQAARRDAFAIAADLEPAPPVGARRAFREGIVVEALNTLADLVVAVVAGRAHSGLSARPGLVRRLREISGGAMVLLGLGLLLARRPAS